MPINQIILDELKPELKLESTVNQIMITSFDRASGLPVLISTLAPNESNRFPYKKLMYIQTAALGSYRATRLYAEYLAARVYKVPRSVTFRTAASSNLLPGEIISVEGSQYRLMSVNRAFSADDNSLTTTVTSEWYGDGSGGTVTTTSPTGGGGGN